ncbi:DUF1488 domain-containing protein [Vibrio profundi]|uniref:DUF1488 domain-containing protein n=1 Tax=Vibrio profundi TaxID=1774960 RepID=UPI0037370076
MNQSILFPDIQSWDEDKQAIVFPAQQFGALIECLISIEQLQQMSGQTIDNDRRAIEVFNELRFEIEELAEELIEEEEFDSSGFIHIQN